MLLKRFLSAAVLAIPMWAASGISLYVATNGSDAAAGTKSRPFATLERAREEVRRRKPSVPVTIYVRGGVYRLERTFQLDARDSGTAAAPVVWRALPGEAVTLSGGVPITGFTPWRGAVLQADYRGAPFRRLFHSGSRLPLARYPNYDPTNPYGGGWAYVDGKPVYMYDEVPGDTKRSFVYKASDARLWAHPQEGEVVIFPRYNWWNNIVPIASIDTASRAVTLAADCSYAIRPLDRYYVQGMLEELDAPGEWYLDTRAGKLYVWPPKGAAAGLTVHAPSLATVVELGEGTSYVTLRGFTIEHAAGTAVLLNGTRRCLIAGNTIRNSGDYRGSAVEVNGGSHNGIAGNDIHHIGANAIVISGGDRLTLTPAENYADNNYIHHAGVDYKQGAGIYLMGCGNRASHNLIHDVPRMAVIFSGNNLLIEYNRIRHVNLETEDTGAVDTGGRDWISSRGTVLRYNYMSDSLGYGQVDGKWTSPHYSWGVYLDDNTGGVDVIGNIVVRAYRGLIHLHNARDNRVENNIFIGGGRQQAEFNGWPADSPMWKRHLPTMIEGYRSVQGQPAWKSMRNMHIDPEHAVLPSGLIMSGNVFERNIVYWTGAQPKLFSSRFLPLDHNRWDRNLYWNGGHPMRIALGGDRGEIDFAAWQKAGCDVHSLVRDPLFVDHARENYRLRPDSPALQLGFQPIPVDRIGPYRDPLRATWPIVEAEGAREHPVR